ncbi:uncharacterized protein LOC133794420 [Humulus lupulus]|uniref:uncharacterized protein LOC133794420 n=1 Tax=Humulus lupulus TaxID=3486 RepID=UPI002B413F50|nr:uncharacterized protein LOC133794420 [Humulus lupulus]
MDMKLGKFTLISVTKEVGKFHCCQNFVWDGHCGSPSPPPVYEDRLFSSEAYVPEFKQGKKAVSVPFPGLSEYLRPETLEEMDVKNQYYATIWVLKICIFEKMSNYGEFRRFTTWKQRDQIVDF